MISAVSYIFVLKKVESDSRTQIQALINTIYSTAAVAAYVDNKELVQDVLSSLQENTIVDCAVLVTERITMSSREGCGSNRYTAEKIRSPFYQEKVIGEVRVYTSEAAVLSEARSTFRLTVSVILMVIVITAAFVAFATYVLLSRPIERITKRLTQIDFKRLGKKYLKEEHRDDEIGEICKIVNELISEASQKIYQEKALKEETERVSNNFRLIFEMSDNALAVTDDQLSLLSYNPRFIELMKTLNPSDQPGVSSVWLTTIFGDQTAISEKILNNDVHRKPFTIELHLNSDKPESERWMNLTYIKSLDQFGKTNILIFIRDNTRQQRKLINTEFKANHDALTRLYNRRAATLNIRHMLSQLPSRVNCAIIMVDLDGFKEVNDTFGHDAGDAVLKAVSARMQHIVRKSDIVSRWGGDEFLICLYNIDEHQTSLIAKKILSAVEQKIPLASNELAVNVSASIGVAISSDDVGNFQELFDQADRAMYAIKKTGKGGVQFFDPAFTP